MAEAAAERPAEDEGEAAEVVPATTSAAAAPVDVQTDDWTSNNHFPSDICNEACGSIWGRRNRSMLS